MINESNIDLHLDMALKNLQRAEYDLKKFTKLYEDAKDNLEDCIAAYNDLAWLKKNTFSNNGFER